VALTVALGSAGAQPPAATAVHVDVGTPPHAARSRLGAATGVEPPYRTEAYPGSMAGAHSRTGGAEPRDQGGIVRHTPKSIAWHQDNPDRFDQPFGKSLSSPAFFHLTVPRETAMPVAAKPLSRYATSLASPVGVVDPADANVRHNG
jgi:hypothetical protein